MKIAVVGAGIYGVTLATILAKKYTVDLFEKETDIMQAASGINQFRLHRGYHYPRSAYNAALFEKSLPSFKQYYADAIISGIDYYYCIAKTQSKITANQFVDFCKRFSLPLQPIDLSIINKSAVSLIARVEENLLDPSILKSLCKQYLTEGNISVHLQTPFTKRHFSKYDRVVLCTYASLNNLLTHFPTEQASYEFAVCEKLVIKLPTIFQNKSVVVFDGPFFAIDPFGRTGLHLMSHVTHAVHQTNVGKYPIIDKKFLPLLNKGLVTNPSISHAPAFIDTASYYIPAIKKAVYKGSFFTIKTLLPEDNVDRPTIIQRIDDKVFTVLGGKIINCVDTAMQVATMIDV